MQSGTIGNFLHHNNSTLNNFWILSRLKNSGALLRLTRVPVPYFYRTSIFNILLVWYWALRSRYLCLCVAPPQLTNANTAADVTTWLLYAVCSFTPSPFLLVCTNIITTILSKLNNDRRVQIDIYFSKSKWLSINLVMTTMGAYLPYLISNANSGIVCG